MARKRTIVSSESKISGGTGIDTVRTTLFTGAGVVCYQNIAFVDETSNATRVDVGFVSGSRELLLDSVTSPGAGVVYRVKGDVFLTSDWVCFVRFVGATAGDRLSLYVYGYYSEDSA